MNTIQEQWDSFRKKVMAKDAPPIQVQEMRLAFYTGAESMLRMSWELGDESVSEAAGVEILEGLHDECRRFVQEVTGK